MSERNVKYSNCEDKIIDQSNLFVCVQGERNVSSTPSHECPVSVLKVRVHVCKRGENPQACQSCQPVSDYGTQEDSYSSPEMVRLRQQRRNLGYENLFQSSIQTQNLCISLIYSFSPYW